VALSTINANVTKPTAQRTLHENWSITQSISY